MGGINSVLYPKTTKKTNELDRMLTTKEVMEHLRIKDKHTFADLIKQGLPHIKIGSRYLIPESKYISWINTLGD